MTTSRGAAVWASYQEKFDQTVVAKRCAWLCLVTLAGLRLQAARARRTTGGWKGVMPLVAALWLISSDPAAAADLSVRISGIKGKPQRNIETIPVLAALRSAAAVDRRRLRRARPAIIEQAADALKPYGYYHPQIDVGFERGDQGRWLIRIAISPGEPVRVAELDIDIRGPGRDDPVFAGWRNEWPLPVGSRLQQPLYDEARDRLLELARQRGYVNSELVEHQIFIDPGINTARITLIMATGQRALFGELRYGELPLSIAPMQRLQPFTSGDHYSHQQVEALRGALAGSGYFSRIDITEEVDRKQEPPRVHLLFDLEPRPRNTWSAGVGLGTDTGPRLTTGWDIHRLNRHGDKLSLGIGVQQTDKEFFLRSEYRRPIGDGAGEFAFASFSVQRKDDDFMFFDTDRRITVFPEIDGNRFNQLVNVGLIRESALGGGWSLERRIFLGLLNESFSTDRPEPGQEQNALLVANPELVPLFNQDRQILHAGVTWQAQNTSGRGFGIEGTHAITRWIGSQDGVLSSKSFLQGYLGVNHQRLLHEDGKLLLKVELGYTETEVDNLLLELGGEQLDFSLTTLPERFRFQTGGDRSVRGFDYQSLSNNKNGSNHLLTASLEYEHRISKDWSLAAFTDTGNAFNDFDRPELEWSTGIGVRFYTAVGPIRLDLARQLDTNDNGIRIHFTIGTPLFTFGSLPYLSGVQ